MGKKMTKKKKAAQRRRQRAYMRAGVMGLLVLLGVGTMVGMATFNGNAKPNRDMQWYVRQGDVEVAAPPAGEGFAEAQSVPAATEDGVPYMSAASLRGSAAGAQQPSAAVIEPETETVPEAADEALAEAAEAFGTAADASEPATAQLPDSSTAELPGEAPEEAEPEAEEPEAVEPEAPTGPVTITITAAGDCTFGGEVGSKSYRRFTQLVQESGYDYFFQNVRSLFENDDLTIVNLEGPLTTNTKTKKHGYIFKGDPSYANILTGSSVELCNLANNHILDYGASGLSETAKTLDEYGVGYCGYTQAYNAVIKGVRVTALGFTKWDHTEEQIVEAVTEARKNCDLLIVNMHWGWESHHEHDPAQTSVGHAAIDAGADLVIGTHPHVYQGIEKYKGRYIVYSLGNFCFAGNANPADKRCLIFQQSFGFTPGMGMAQAGFVDQGINLIPATVSSVKDKNDFQPTIMPAEEGEALLKAVASCSVNFSASDTLWMKDNYMLANGLIKNEDDARPATAETNPDTGAEEPADGLGDGSVT